MLKILCLLFVVVVPGKTRSYGRQYLNRHYYCKYKSRLKLRIYFNDDL